jgi:hypothetical protein
MRMKTSTSPGGRDVESENFTKPRGTSSMVAGVIDTSLSSRIIRLAHSRPEFRDALQPLLYVIAAKKKEEKSSGRKIEQKEFAKLLSYGPRFGVVSAFKPGSDAKNKVRRAQMLADLKRLGYRKVSPLRGEWSLVPDDSFLIQNIRPEDLFELGRKYDQEFVVFANEPSLVGFYYTKGEPQARIIVDPKGDTTFRSLTDMSPYSRARGLDVDFGLLWSKDFAWDGKSALNRKQVRTLLKRDGLKDVTPQT